MKSSIQGSQTEKNLMKAFAGESMAASRYEFFAKAAKKEGFEKVSAIFTKTSMQERSHAKRFYRYLQGGTVTVEGEFPVISIGTTIENLSASSDAENNEWTRDYPSWSAIAKEEGFNEIAAVFMLIANAEKAHAMRFTRLLKSIEDGSIFKDENKIKWECSKCGYIHEGKEPPETCPACLHPKGYFERVE